MLLEHDISVYRTVVIATSINIVVALTSSEADVRILPIDFTYPTVSVVIGGQLRGRRLLYLSARIDEDQRVFVLYWKKRNVT